MQLIADLFNCAVMLQHDDYQAMVENMPDTEQRPPDAPTGISAHGAIHTNPETKTAWVEVFSLYDFDHIAVLDYFMEQLQPDAVDFQVIARGWQITQPRGTIPVAPWQRIKPEESA